MKMKTLILAAILAVLTVSPAWAGDDLVTRGTTVTITLKVHLVPDRVYFPVETRYGMLGCHRAGEIWVERTVEDGTMTTDPWVLGHEVMHELHRLMPDKFKNPDETRKWQHN